MPTEPNVVLQSSLDLRKRALAFLGERPALPLPGAGQTCARWSALASIAAEDVCLAKVLEAHYDALAILHDLRGPEASPGQLWAVWAAEPPDAVATLTDRHGALGLDGRKAWCSGADLVTHALITAHAGDARQLIALDMQADGVSAPAHTWPAVGMARVVSGTLAFDSVRVEAVGAPDAYLSRPGFWHGGAGIAACWFGAACAIAEPLRRDGRDSPHALVALGRIDMALSGAAAVLRELAATIDGDPTDAHAGHVARARCIVERACVEVIDRVNRVMGPGLLCGDPGHARRCADLPVFIRQNHAERDWEQLGKARRAGNAWTL